MPNFKAFLEEKRTWYQSIGSVFCPVLNEWVIFNAKGFRHLRYDGLGKERSKEQQVSRMTLLPHATKVIKSATKISAHRKQYSKSNGIVEYWALESYISKNWVAVVILRKIGSGRVTFYSIWKKKVH